MAGPLYRVRQLALALQARSLDESETELVQEYLPPAAQELYQQMPLGDQRHGLTILRQLLAQGYRARPLLQAALLHDVAKRRVRLWRRGVVVLLNRFSRQALPRLASADPRSWRYPFYLSLHHPEIGAREAEKARLDPQAVALIRCHQAPLPPGATGELSEWQRALKTLDDQN